MTNPEKRDEPLDELGRLLLELKQTTVAVYVTANLIKTLELNKSHGLLNAAKRQLAAEAAIRAFVNAQRGDDSTFSAAHNAQTPGEDTDPDGDHL